MQCTFSTSSTCIKLFPITFFNLIDYLCQTFFLIDCRYDTLFLFTFPIALTICIKCQNFFSFFFPSTSCIKIFFLYFFIDYLYQCSSRCLPWRLEPTPELAHLYSDQCQGFARTIRTRLYYGCMYSLFFCVLCDCVKGGRAGLIQRSIRYCY